MKEDVFEVLTRWGQMGHTSMIMYGVYWHEDKTAWGWSCFIHPWSQGSVTYGGNSATGHHPTNAHEAVRIALRQAALHWPETAEKAQP